MLFPHAFWEADLDTFGTLVRDPAQRGEFFLFYSYRQVAGGSLLLGLVAGEAAQAFEAMPAAQIIARVMSVLKGMAPSTPSPVSAAYNICSVCTRWQTDCFAGGSYSHISVGSSGDDYDILAEPVAARLFFAGEATNRRYPATMHGAFLSGQREAAKIAEVATARAAPLESLMSHRASIQQYAATLDEIFSLPDVEFGSFSLVFDPRSTAPSSPVLVRIAIRNAPARPPLAARPSSAGASSAPTMAAAARKSSLGEKPVAQKRPLGADPEGKRKKQQQQQSRDEPHLRMEGALPAVTTSLDPHSALGVRVDGSQPRHQATELRQGQLGRQLSIFRDSDTRQVVAAAAAAVPGACTAANSPRTAAGASAAAPAPATAPPTRAPAPVATATAPTVAAPASAASSAAASVAAGVDLQLALALELEFAVSTRATWQQQHAVPGGTTPRERDWRAQLAESYQSLMQVRQQQHLLPPGAAEGGSGGPQTPPEEEVGEKKKKKKQMEGAEEEGGEEEVQEEKMKKVHWKRRTKAAADGQAGGSGTRGRGALPQVAAVRLYTVVTREQALLLREVRGGDAARMLVLCDQFGAKLVGRRGLGPEGDELVAAVLLARAARRTATRASWPLVAAAAAVTATHRSPSNGDGRGVAAAAATGGGGAGGGAGGGVGRKRAAEGRSPGGRPLSPSHRVSAGGSAAGLHGLHSSLPPPRASWNPKSVRMRQLTKRQLQG
eukprot:jgi/Mesen1/2989/ME000177S02263